ncbi:MAG: chemotaxis protein CheA [Gammaproteobacteria bacterium HGW-Gammaproteobacteria-3]|nr:MAG: chemotaxis protein CheA [Gammaproteobacteria bacterium HGW-Gammaproteobacteria-3]
MAIDLDDEILQDFLVEGGEILELLSEQLVQLEQAPHDLELLNAIFRGFHTVKGGAGFLAIEPLIAVCHKAEDVFNVLRQGDRLVSTDLMDVVLQVLDVVNIMFDQVRSGQDPESASPELLGRLEAFTTPESEAEPAGGTVEADTNSVMIDPALMLDTVEQEFEAMLEQSGVDSDGASPYGGADEITGDEFEGLLDALHGKNESPGAEAIPAAQTESGGDSGDITEAEFEALLDTLHGKGGAPTAAKKVEEKPKSKPSGVDEITEAEFDSLLDELHGKGQFKGVPDKKLPPSSNSAQAAKPAKAPLSSVKAAKDKFEAAAKTSTPEPKPNASVGSGEKGKDKPAAAAVESTVRVDTQVLDDIMNMVGELVLVRNRLQNLRSASESDDQMSKAVANLDIVTADLQLAVMKTRMQPIKKVFGRFPRVVRDLARSLNKEIRLELVGEDTDLDKNLVEALADPLVHLVRNAVDHGVEGPDERLAAGKSREGLVVLAASQQGDHIELSIKDDGKGMNADALRAKVVEKGLMDAESAARLDRKECFNLIFMPGFSTKTEISDVSGRGVGMDVVKTRITQMNGTVEVDSQQGVGSTIIIKVPLTLAIMPTLMVKLGDQSFALPLASVLEILDLDLRVTNVVDGRPVVMVRNKALPLFYLGEWLIRDVNYIVKKKQKAHVVVVNAGGRQVGFVVDQLIGQEEVVIKALGAKLHGLDGLAGATITGDGRIALILDVPGLMKKYAV